MALPRVSIKGEYLYYDLGTANTANVGALYYANKSGLSGVMHTGVFDGHVFRLGVNYHFNGASAEPVVAKY
jgi:hypothetical protein